MAGGAGEQEGGCKRCDFHGRGSCASCAHKLLVAYDDGDYKVRSTRPLAPLAQHVSSPCEPIQLPSTVGTHRSHDPPLSPLSPLQMEDLARVQHRKPPQRECPHQMHKAASSVQDEQLQRRRPHVPPEPLPLLPQGLDQPTVMVHEVVETPQGSQETLVFGLGQRDAAFAEAESRHATATRDLCSPPHTDAQEPMGGNQQSHQSIPATMARAPAPILAPPLSASRRHLSSQQRQPQRQPQRRGLEESMRQFEPPIPCIREHVDCWPFRLRYVLTRLMMREGQPWSWDWLNPQAREGQQLHAQLVAAERSVAEKVLLLRRAAGEHDARAFDAPPGGALRYTARLHKRPDSDEMQLYEERPDRRSCRFFRRCFACMARLACMFRVADRIG